MLKSIAAAFIPTPDPLGLAALWPNMITEGRLTFVQWGRHPIWQTLQSVSSSELPYLDIELGLVDAVK